MGLVPVRVRRYYAVVAEALKIHLRAVILFGTGMPRSQHDYYEYIGKAPEASPQVGTIFSRLPGNHHPSPPSYISSPHYNKTRQTRLGPKEAIYELREKFSCSHSSPRLIPGFHPRTFIAVRIEILQELAAVPSGALRRTSP